MFFSLTQISQLLIQYKYLILFPVVMFEGPITTIIAGVLSSLGYLSFWTAYPVVVVADLTSDVFYYAFGRWGREKFIERWGHHFGVTTERMKKMEAHFGSHGGKMLIFGKIADPLSSTIQTAAGMTRMSFSEFIWFNVAATLPKSLILLAIGFYFGEAFAAANFYRQLFGIVASVLGIAVLIGYFLYRRKKQKEVE